MSNKSLKRIRIIADEKGTLGTAVYIDGQKLNLIEEIGLSIKPPSYGKNEFPVLDIKKVLLPSDLKQQNFLEEGFREICNVEIIFEKALVKFQENVIN